MGSRYALAIATDELEARTSENHVISCTCSQSDVDGRGVADDSLISGATLDVVVASARRVATERGTVPVDVRVVAIAAEDAVVAASGRVSVQGVRVPNQEIAVIAAQELIVASADRVTGRCKDIANHVVLSRPRVYLIVPEASGEKVVSAEPADQIVATLTVDCVVAG